MSGEFAEIEQVLSLQAASATELRLLDQQTERIGDKARTRLTIQGNPEVLDTAALGFLFAIARLSFDDARPRAGSEAEFRSDDEWRVVDLLQHLRFRDGTIGFYADFVRGRMVKTHVQINEEGTITVDTIGRGEASTRWLTRLSGREVLSVV